MINIHNVMPLNQVRALLLFSCCLGSIYAQDVAPTPEGATAQKNAPQLRGWIFPGKSEGEVALSIAENPDEQPLRLAACNDAVFSASPGYVEVAAGDALLELRSGDRVLANARVPLQAGRYYTIIAWRSASNWELKVFSDGSSKPDSADRSLRILNFADDRETMFSVDQKAESKVGRNSLQETKVPAKTCMLAVRVLAADGGPPAQSAVELDLSSSGSAYIVIAPDYRGRMRPRVIVGGAVSED